MKKFCIILGFITAVIALILAVTPLYMIALIPLLIAFLCGLGVLFLSKKEKSKSIRYLIILIIISLSLIVFKAIFQKAEVGNTEELEQLDESSKEEAIKELEDIEIED